MSDTTGWNMELSQAFQILEIPAGSTYAEAKAAYLLLVKVWHPDKHTHDEKVLAKATSKLQELNSALSMVEEFYRSGGVKYAVAKESPQDIMRDQMINAIRSARARYGIFGYGR
jgi:curved DNA-binding protein CbpA